DCSETLKICNFEQIKYKTEQPQREKKSVIDIEVLKNILSSISAVKLNDQVLPKYLYPSGGSTYPIRLFLNLSKSIGEIAEGYYYYNPVKYNLCKFDQSNLETKSNYELQFVVHWPAIEPLYASFSKKLVYLELGHMLSLIFNVLDNHCICYKLEIINKCLSCDNSLIARLFIGTEKIDLPIFNLAYNLFYKEQDQNNYCSITTNKNLLLNNENIFLKASDYYQIIEESNLLLVLEGTDTNEHLIMAGLLYQNISTKLYAKDIGSCMLGFSPYQNALYTMVLGKIGENEKRQANSSFTYKSLGEIINAQLSEQLPDYMLPYDYIVLNTLPLSENGKLDKNGLKKFIFKEHSSCMPPKNELEVKMCALLANILDLDVKQIGVNDNFFRLGGDSISAIQFVGKLRKELNLNINVKDLFTHNTIERLIKNVIIKDLHHGKDIDKDNYLSLQQSEPILQESYLYINDARNLINEKYLNKLQKDHQIERLFFANSLQQGFIYHYLKRGEVTDVNRVQLLWQYNNKIDVAKLKEAWKHLQAKYGALRLRFVWDEELMQIIDKSVELDWQFFDLIDKNLAAQKNIISNIQKQDLLNPYKLEAGKLFRVYLIKQADNLYTCLFSCHHIILDAWSNTILLNIVHEIYHTLVT
ncbi:MAG: condensation domain-containing protein, partial [Alphaproteobacteria bacterium]